MALLQAKPFRLALLQLGGLTSNKASNIAVARKAVATAAASVPKPDLIVLPEIWNSPYAVTAFREYAERVPNVKDGQEVAANGSATGAEGETVTAMREMAREAGTYLIGGSIPEHEDASDNIYNTLTAYDPQGRMVAKHRKVHLFDIDIPGRQTFKESDTLTAGKTLNSFNTPFGKIGVAICYDIRFPEMAMVAAREGCVAMIYPAAFNTTTGPMHWTLLQRSRWAVASDKLLTPRANDNQMYVAMCSPARHPGAAYQAYGHSSVVDPIGNVVAEADEKEAIVYADIDTDLLATTRRNLPVTMQRRFDVYPDVSGVSK